MTTRTFVIAVSAVVCMALSTTNAGAQRFEGIITMKLSGGMNAMMQGGRGGGGGRGANADAGGNASRGGDGRGGARGGAAVRAGGGDARGSAGIGGRGGDAPNDPRAQAMRDVASGNLQQIEYMTRRGKVRIAVGTGGGAAPAAAMIYAPEDGLMYTIFPALSMYAEMSMNDLNASARRDSVPPPSGRAAPRPPVITHTKQFELIAGHRCEHITVATAANKTDVCMGKGLGAFVLPMVARTDAWNQVMTEENGFPLKVVGSDGKVIMEVTKIERKALAESLFNVPDSYTKMPNIGARPPG